MDQKIKLILVDDGELYRNALKEFLKQYTEMGVVGEAENGKDLFKLLRSIHADIILLDIEMPFLNGKETLDKLVKRYPDIKVIILTIHKEFYFELDCINSGASAYLNKDCDEKEFIKTIRAVFNEGIYIRKEIVEELVKRKQSETSPVYFKTSLSEREMEVLIELNHGSTELEIAVKLNISRDTVHSHKNNLLRKTRTHNTAQLLLYSAKNGLL